MTTLQELCIKRKNQIANSNGTEALRNRIAQLKTLSGDERLRFAEKPEGLYRSIIR